MFLYSFFNFFLDATYREYLYTKKILQISGIHFELGEGFWVYEKIFEVRYLKRMLGKFASP